MAFSRDNKTQHDANPDAADDTGAEYYLQAIKVVDGVSTDVSINVAQSRAIIGTVPAPADIFLMSIDPESLIAAIGPITQDHNQFKIQLNDITPPTIGDGTWTLTRTPSNYAIATAWTDAILQPGTYSLFVNNGLTVTQVLPDQTITATTTQTVPQTPNDVNFPSLTNVTASATMTSNTVLISGLLAPTAISISGGANAKYIKNGGTATDVPGVIENNDTIALRQDASGSDSTPTTITVSLGLRDEDWTVTTAATGVTPGVISIVAATYSGAENGTITIDLARDATNGIVGCRVSTLYDDTYHTAAPGVNYVQKTAELVTFPDGNGAQTVTITNVDSDMLLDVMGELVIDLGSEFGGATVNSALNATLFLVTGTGSESAYQQEAAGDHIIKVKYDDALSASPAEAVNTPRDGGTWGNVAGNSGSMQALPVADFNDTPGYSGAAQELSFFADFQVTGDHYFWLDSMAADGGSNSCWIGVDDNENAGTFGVVVSDGTYRYSDNSASAHVLNIATTGVHKISVWCREGGFNLTTILVTDNAAYDAETAGAGDAEAISTFSSASGGANPNNPTLPLGPSPVIDDKTPDAFPFPALIDKATGSVVESNVTDIVGINVPTEISISDDPTGTAAYKIDGGSYVTAAGFVTVGQTVQVKVTASNTLGATVTMSLKVGTVTQVFSVTAKDSGFIVLPGAGAVTVTADNQTISGDDISPVSGPTIIIKNGAENTIIEGCRLYSPDADAIFCDGNTGFTTVRSCEISAIGNAFGAYTKPAGGFSLVGCSIHDNTIEDVRSGISIQANGGFGDISIVDNWIKNVHRLPGTKSGGSNIALSWVRGPNIVVDGNILINIPGESEPEDKISFFQLYGKADNWAKARNNKVFGTGDSLSCATMLCGDEGGAYVLFEDNIGVNSGQSGIGFSDGHDITMRRNKMFCEPLYQLADPSIGVSNSGQSVGYTAWAQGNPAPYNITVEEVEVTWWKAANYAGRGGEEFLQPFHFPDWDYFGPQDIAGWSTCKFDTATRTEAGLDISLWNDDWFVRPGRL